ncbi:MAG TPA: XdhC/CoxI family protein [Terriglobales bacterium]|nr:XdhC/CoxI family protein [Terriglobales bacterium]
MTIYDEIARLQREGRACALATIINVRGSIPSVATAKMLVRDDGTILGTIGGGCVEAEVWQEAKEVMSEEKPRTLTFNLDQTPDKDTGLVCGGTLQIFVEPILPLPVLYIFGAGHIGLNVYRIARAAGFEVVVADDRDTYANRDRFPEARDIYADDMDRVMQQLKPQQSSFIVIVTRGHRHDMRVLGWAVNTAAHYVGMIGSKRKVLTVCQELEKQGVPPEKLKRAHAPIGIDIGATTPEEIAVSIVAELIADRRRCQAALPHLRCVEELIGEEEASTV